MNHVFYVNYCEGGTSLYVLVTHIILTAFLSHKVLT